MEIKNNRTVFLIDKIPPHYGGAYLRTYRMASRMKKKKLLYKILTLFNENEYKENGDYEIGKNDIKFINSGRQYPYFLMVLMIPFKLLFFFIFEHSKFTSVYIVSIQWYTILVVILCKIFNKNSLLGITLLGADDPLLPSKNFVHKIYLKIKNLAFFSVDYVLVNSPAVVKVCISAGINKEKIKLLLNPIDYEKFSPLKSNKEIITIRKGLNIPDNSLVILFIGGINYRKGVEYLLPIFTGIRNSYSDALLLVCGNDRYPESGTLLAELESKLNKKQNFFHFLGTVENIHEVIQISDLFIFPSKREGLPNVIIEAMACECSIISNKINGITDFLLPKEMLVENNNVNQFVMKSLTLLNDKKLRTSLEKKNRNIIINNFNTDKIDESFIELIGGNK